MKTKKQRFVSSFLAVVLILNLIDGRILSYCWQQIKAFAAAQDYTGYFQWDISELTTPPAGGSASGENLVIVTNKDGKQVREITLTNNTDLFLKESADDNPVLKTTFYFNLKRGVDAGLLEFTITGMDELIRNGTLKLNDQDPNLVKTWEITQDEKTGNYTFKNKVRVTSNNETTFTWQFNSREAVTDTNITLNTECKITEIEYDPDTGLEVKREQITLDTNDLTFSYESEPDKSQVKIVCEDLEELDVNNLNVAYDWRSYRSTLGLEGITEYTKTNGGLPFGKTTNDFETPEAYTAYLESIAKYMGYADDPDNAEDTALSKFLVDHADGDTINWDELTLYDAHAIKQSREEQVKSQMARGIKRADYFIEVIKPDNIDWKDVLIVNSNGDRVPVVETQINGNTVWGFYDFQGAGDRKPGESYSCVYRVGVLNDTIKNYTGELNIQLTGHYLVTYQDTTAPIDYTDSAAHQLSIIDDQPIGDGDYLHKFNNYEINNGNTYNGVEYQSHAKHYSPVNQLLYDSVFNGRTVTYSLSASTRQATYADGKTEDINGNARKYDLIYEDSAPKIKNFNGAEDRLLTCKEYDFTRVSISKLVNGNTVGVIDSTVTDDIAYKDEEGFSFVIYGKSNDSENAEYSNTWKEVGSGTTLAESEVLLPAGIDEIQIVVKDLKIRTYLRAFVDIQYNLDSDLRNHIYIDTDHDYDQVEVTNGDGTTKTKKVRHEDTNKGTHLVNTFTRKQYLDTNYDPNSFNENNFQNTSEDHSNTWLRESTTTIDSHTSIEDFKFHTLSEEELKEHGGIPVDYYSTVISSGGTIQSDSESSLNHFAVYSKLPDGVTPSEGWLEQFKESLVFNGVLQGTNEQVDAQFMLDNNAVTVYYDAGTKCIVAEFECNGFSLRADQLVSADFSYPAEISLAKVKSSGLAQTPFLTETYLTVLDDNVKLSPAKDKTLTEVNETPYQKAKSAKSSADTKVSAMGSQKNNYSTKSVRSFYNDWVYDNDTEVDGSNTHHLEEKRMTSEYDYALAFHRITTENEVVKNPMILDIVEGLRGSAWHGRVNKIYFDSKSYPADSDYHPVVYYILSKENGADNPNVTNAEGGDYSKKNNTIMNAISHFQKYGNETDVSNLSEQYSDDLDVYNTLKNKITTREEGWKMATENSDGSWSIEQDDVYAVAVIFEGEYTVRNGYLELGAYMSMTAPALENNSDAEKIINNRATYNEAHVFAQGTDANGTDFPMYSVSNRTLVVLRHSVELEKVDSKNNRRLSGAKFTIFSKDLGEEGFANNKENANIVSYYTFDKRRNKNDINQMLDMEVDLSGVLQLNLSPGIYYYMETSPPTGYHPDSRQYRFRVTADTDAVYYYQAKLYSSEELNNEYVIVNHREYGEYPDIYDNTKTAIDNNFAFYVFDTAGEKIKFSIDSGKYVHDIHATNPTDTVYATDGLITLKGLLAGTYFLGTDFSTSNLDDSNGYWFSIADNSEISFNVIKKSPMSTGLVYNLYEKSGSGISANDRQCYFSKSDSTYSLLTAPPTENASDAMKIVPESSGKVSLTGLDSTKEYYFVIVDSPTGYKISPNKSVYDVKNQTSVELYAAENIIKQNRIVVADDPIESAKAKFQKIDGTDSVNYGNFINGAVYNMYFIESDGSESLMYFQYDLEEKNYVYMGTTGMTGYTSNLTSGGIQSGTPPAYDVDNGMIQISGLPYGTYFMQEKTAPMGYQLNPAKQYFRVSAVTIDKDANLIFASDDTSEEETSNSDSNTKDAEGSESEDSGNSENAESISNSSRFVMPLKDNEILSKIVLNKTEEINDENYLENAEYALYRLQKGEDLEEAKAASIDCKGNTKAPSFIKYWGKEPVSISYTDGTGEASFNKLPFGTYLLYEQKPPVGYKWNNDIGKWETWTIKDAQHTQNNQVIILSEESVSNNSSVTYETVTDAEGNEETVRVVTYHEFFAKHLDERKEGSARLIKQNKDFLGLSDAVFALYQVNLTDDEIAKVLGKTTAELHEMSESDIQKELGKKELSVNDININNHFDMKEGKPKTKTETDPDTNEEITKIIDTAIDQNMKTNADFSTRGATKTISGLEWGIYYFYEVKAPAGYQADSTPYVFAVDSKSVDTLIEVNATDAKTYGEVWLYKQAKEKIENTNDHLKLFGAQFNLYTNDGNLVKAIPKLRLGGLKTTAHGVNSNGRKEFLVKSFDVKSNTQIEFKILDDDSSINYTVTVDYENTKDGKITDITIDDTAFTTKYGSNFNKDYTEDDETKNHKDELRLAYYVISADGTQYYDDTLKKYVDFPEEPTSPYHPSFIDADGNYDEAGYTAAYDKYWVDLADYVAGENLKSCITQTYVTADEGGRLNVRGLDWNSYYFHETVPPDGYGLADDVIFTVNAYNCDNQFLPCEDPRATASIIVDKQIPDASYFNAYGEPTFMFKIYGLEKFSEDDTTADYTTNNTNYKKTGREYTLSIHLSDPNTTGSAMVDVPVGQYLIEEIPVSRYVCTNLELVDGTRDNEEDKFKSVGLTTPTSYVIYHDDTKYDINTTGVNQWKAFCDLEGGDKTFGEVVAFHIKYTNGIERYDNFSHVSYADNQIPEREYITAFKPLYSSLIPVYSGTDETYTYEIDLDDAMKNEVFEGVLTYNTGKTVNLTDLSKIQFKTSGNAPVTNVQWDSTTKKLKVTVSEPSASAGSTISLDVGYSDASDFDSYDTTNTSMVRGTLNLTFSEIQAEHIKKLTLKNDNNNKSYFPYADTTNTIQDVTSVAVLYAKSEKTVEEEGEEKIKEVFTKSMQNTAYTDTLNISSGFEFQYWYLLDADGKPVLDKESKVIQFQRNDDPTKDEIVQYMFHGTWPAYLKTEADPDNGIEAKNLIPDTLADPASVENINSFTFQAEVEEVKEPKAKLLPGKQVSTAIESIAGEKSNVVNFIRGEMRNKPDNAVVISVTDDREKFPKDVYAWYDGNGTVYWGSDEPNPYMNEESSNGDMRMFYQYANLETFEVNWDTSLVTSLKQMFTGCTKLTVANNSYTNCTLTPANLCDMFQGCTSLTNCTILRNLNADNLVDHRAVLQNCKLLTAETMAPIFATWKLKNIPSSSIANNNFVGNEQNSYNWFGTGQSTPPSLCNDVNGGVSRRVRYDNGVSTLNKSLKFRIYQCDGHKIMIIATNGGWALYYIPDDSEIYVNNVLVTDASHKLITPYV